MGQNLNAPPLYPLISVNAKVWNDPDQFPHQRTSKVFIKLNFKLHIYFAIKLIMVEKANTSASLKKVPFIFRAFILRIFLFNSQVYLHKICISIPVNSLGNLNTFFFALALSICSINRPSDDLENQNF